MAEREENVIQLMPVDVRKAFGYWQTHGRVDAETSRNVGVHVNTVRKWKVRYNWSEVADKIDRKAAEEIENQLVKDQVVSTVGMVTNIEQGLALILNSPQAVAEMVKKPADAKVLMEVRARLLDADNTVDGEHKTAAQKKASQILHDKFGIGG